MTPATLPRVANGPRKTPAHTLTIPDEVWNRLDLLARYRAVSVSKLVSTLLAHNLTGWPEWDDAWGPKPPTWDTDERVTGL